MLVTTTLLMTVSSVWWWFLHRCRGQRPVRTHRSGSEFLDDRRVDEARDVGDPPIAQGQDVDGARPPGAVHELVAQEAGLAVDGPWLEPPGRLEQPLCEEPRHHVAAVEPGRERRHREPCVLG